MTKEKKELFLKYKNGVLAQYSTAKTFYCNVFNGFYVSDENGLQLIPSELTIDNKKTIFDAWKFAYKNMKFIEKYDEINRNTIIRNTRNFNNNSKAKSKLQLLKSQH